MGLILPQTGQAEGDVSTIAPTYLPNFFGVGLGGYPDYIGSDDYALGAAPFGRYSWGNRYVDLVGTFVTANALDHPNWRVGPTLNWRFGRKDVDDPVVDLLPDIDGTLELGVFAAYEAVSNDDPRDRWLLSGGIAQDVGGVHEGQTAWVSARKWMPLTQYGALGISIGATYGSSDYMGTYFSVTPDGAASSGLNTFSAGSGVRDVRASLIYIQPISREWQLGAGVIYSQLIGDAKDSPVTAERGSSGQFYYGIGISRAF
jgi:outer membrane protein